MSVEPAVAVIPYGAKLGLFPSVFPLDEASWPLGQPPRLKGKKLRDLHPDDHVLMYVNDNVYFRPSFGTQAKVSLMIMEPRAIHARHFDRLTKNSSRFHRILAHDEEFLASCPNSDLLLFGTTWISDRSDLDVEKSQNLSLIASKKASLEGHALRHEMVKWMRSKEVEFDALGGGYKSFGDKSEGLARYRYSVVIENVRERGYFTEKLLDAIFCETVPIYWGCPNIDEYFDTTAMIICETRADIERAVTSISREDYERRVDDLRALKEQAAKYVDLDHRAAQHLLG
jgi:hypothetical protein